MFLSLDIHSLLYRIFVFKSIAIIIPCVIVCSFYQCTVDYSYGSANILRNLKTLLVLSMNLIVLWPIALLQVDEKLISCPKIDISLNNFLATNDLLHSEKCSFIPET